MLRPLHAQTPPSAHSFPKLFEDSPSPAISTIDDAQSARVLRPRAFPPTPTHPCRPPAAPADAQERKAAHRTAFRVPDDRRAATLTAGAALTVPAERHGAQRSHAALELILDHTQDYPALQLGETVWQEAAGPEITLRNARVAEELVNDELDRRSFHSPQPTAADRQPVARSAALRKGRKWQKPVAATFGALDYGPERERASVFQRHLRPNRSGAAECVGEGRRPAAVPIDDGGRRRPFCGM